MMRVLGKILIGKFRPKTAKKQAETTRKKRRICLKPDKENKNPSDGKKSANQSKKQ